MRSQLRLGSALSADRRRPVRLRSSYLFPLDSTGWLIAADPLRVVWLSNPSDQVKNDWNNLTIGVCTGPSGSWQTLWPRMKHYD